MLRALDGGELTLDLLSCPTSGINRSRRIFAVRSDLLDQERDPFGLVVLSVVAVRKSLSEVASAGQKRAQISKGRVKALSTDRER